MDTSLDSHFSIMEVKHAVDKTKNGKAFGADLIPVDVLKNETSVMFYMFYSMFVLKLGAFPLPGIKLS